MSDLTQQKCEACRADAPRVTLDESKELLKQIPDWKIMPQASIDRLRRMFKFGNYSEAVRFSNKAAELAEEEDHHPSILLEWGQVEVNWWTHKIGGLHKNDFISAAKTDVIFNS